MEPNRLGPEARLAARALILQLALAAAAVALRETLAAVLIERDPERAAALAPGNARAAVAAARHIVEQGGSATGRAVTVLTEIALRRDATLTSAIELRALQAGGEAGADARLFALSNRISRRSLATRLWLIQRSVDAGDVEGALGDFDIALRTSSAAPPILFPVLVRAASDPGLVAPIAHVLDRREEWRSMFFLYAIDHGAAAELGRLALAMRDRDAFRADDADRRLVTRLVADGRYQEARGLDRAFGASGDASGGVIDPDFSAPNRGFPFGWSLTEKGASLARRGSIAGRTALLYRGGAASSDQLAAQLLTLADGRYRLVARAAGGGSAGEAPYWSITCARGGGSVVALLDQPISGTAATSFTVKHGCAGQWLVLRLRPGGENSSGAIAAIWVERVQD